MPACHRALRFVLLGAVFAAPMTTTAPQDQNESVTPEMASRDVRLQASMLAERFRRAQDDVLLREQIAAEAIQLGEPCAEKVLGVAEFEKAKSFKAYGVQFRKQINKADTISAVGVVASSTKLREARERLIQLGDIEISLREFLKPGPPPMPAGAATAEDATPNFEEILRTEEEKAVEQWMLAQGYGQLSSDESAVISAINQLRQEAGLATLEVDYKLCFAARDHSRDMLRKQFFSHISPVHGKKTLSDRARRVGTVALGENIAQCNTDVSPIKLWLDSKPHKQIMYGKWFDTIGVGRAGNNFTAMFGRKTAETKH